MSCKLKYSERIIKMGHLTGSIFGLPSGRAGDIIFRVRNGKPVFYLSPYKPRIITSEQIKRNNTRFKFCASFCSAIYKIVILRNSWQESSIKSATKYNKMMKVNLTIIGPDPDISGLKLIPDEGKFTLDTTEIILDDSMLMMETLPYTGVVAGEKRISLQGVLKLSLPEDVNNKPVRFIPFYSKDEYLTPGVSLNFLVNFETQMQELIKKYTKKTLLYNFAVKDLQAVADIFSKESYLEYN
jgi:hypothetical protein